MYLHLDNLFYLGLSLIYESTSDENKHEMMEYLTNSLMQGNRPKQQKIEAETKIFEEGALGSSPDGYNISFPPLLLIYI